MYKLCSCCLLACWLFALFSCGFYDYERSESKKIIGKFYVVNLHLKEHPGAILVFKQKNGTEQVFLKINEQIDSLVADSTVILVKTRPNPMISYYMIIHNAGEAILTVRTISEDEFLDTRFNMKVFKEFTSDSKD